MELTRSTTVGDDRIVWEVLGDGPPVVLVHGFPSSSHVWRRVAPALAAAGHRVHVYDLPGFGRSSRRDGQEVWFDRQAAVLGVLLDRWGLRAPTIVAHDMGAGSAVVLAGRAPERVDRLVLVSAAVLEPVIAEATEHMAGHLETYRSMPAPTWEAVVRARLATTTHVPMASDALEPYVTPWLGTGGQAAYLRVVEQVARQRTTATEPALRTLRVPTDIVWGLEDTWLPVEMADRAHALVEGSELHVIPAAGHFLPEDAPAALVRVILRTGRLRAA